MAEPLNQKTAKKLLEEHGWTETRGGKHVVKMTKPGVRPITLPHHREGPLSGGRRTYTSPMPTEYRAAVHEEDGSYWAEVAELPGCFASGSTIDELKEAIVEAITLYLADDERVEVGSATASVDSLRVLVSSY